MTLAGGVLSALAASVLLVLPGKRRTDLLPHLVSFATGTLLAAAFLGLLPHALEQAGMDKLHELGMAVLGGILVFFILEKMVLWRHCHHDECEAHGPDASHRDAASGAMILFGDALHNFLDGVLIAAAFLTDIHLGVVTSFAVIAHEIPQEVGDIAVLLNGGMPRGKVFFLNVSVSLTSVVGGLLAYFWLENTQAMLPYVLAVAASSFIYVAVADLIPGLHRRVDLKAAVWQIVLIVAGIAVIMATHNTLH
jgi:zinc and cadmium transporter